MFRILLTILLFYSSLALFIPEDSRSRRIIGGNTAQPGQFPHQVSLRTILNVHFCGGSVINSRFVLSAAHCMIQRRASNTNVVVGAHRRLNDGITHHAQEIINHPRHNMNTSAFDIALVVTISVIVESTTVRFLPLGSAFVSTAPGAFVSGWGQISHPGPGAEVLQYLKVNIITNADCRSRLTGNNVERIDDSKICGVFPIGQGTCFEDSGGPLTLNNRVIGIVSWGIPCATGAPDMFSRVSAVYGWINEQLSMRFGN